MGNTPVVIFIVLLDLGKKSSFVDRHWLFHTISGILLKKLINIKTFFVSPQLKALEGPYLTFGRGLGNGVTIEGTGPWGRSSVCTQTVFFPNLFVGLKK
jgi:hypothetical protein